MQGQIQLQEQGLVKFLEGKGGIASYWGLSAKNVSHLCPCPAVADGEGQDICTEGALGRAHGKDKDPQSDNFHPNVLKPTLFPAISVKMSCGRDVEMEPLQLPGSLCLISLQHQEAPRAVGTQQAPGLILQERVNEWNKSISNARF